MFSTLTTVFQHLKEFQVFMRLSPLKCLLYFIEICHLGVEDFLLQPARDILFLVFLLQEKTVMSGYTNCLRVNDVLWQNVLRVISLEMLLIVLKQSTLTLTSFRG